MITATSVSIGPPITAVANASASATVLKAVVWAKGVGSGGVPSRGFEVAAIGDTSVLDSFQVSVTPINATSANMVLNGEALLQRTVPAPAVGRLDVLVYPDTTAANLDPSRTGAGALFVGRLIVDRDGIEKADGGWSSGDFQVQLTTDRARIRAVNLTKVIACPNSANLATVIQADASAVAVPMQTPLTLTMVSTLLAAAGYWALRRRRVEA